LVYASGCCSYGRTAACSAFMMHFNDSDGRAYPSLETITKLCGLARRTVRDMIDLLLADDNIRIVEKRGEPGRGHPTIVRDSGQAAARRRRRGAQARRLARRSPEAQRRQIGNHCRLRQTSNRWKFALGRGSGRRCRRVRRVRARHFRYRNRRTKGFSLRRFRHRAPLPVTT
jgi:hypothetical protein